MKTQLCSFECRHEHMDTSGNNCSDNVCFSDCKECAMPYKLVVRMRDGLIVIERAMSMSMLLHLATGFILTGNVVLFYTYTTLSNVEITETLGAYTQ